MLWFDIVKMVLPLVLSQIPKTKPIANEVTDAVVEAEQLFPAAPGDKTGPDKLNHVIRIARDAAQATDELRGSEDEVAGVVGQVVAASIPLVNEVSRQAGK